MRVINYLSGNRKFLPVACLSYGAVVMKRFSFWVFLLLFGVYFLCYNGWLSHVLFYHEKHHLFLFTAAYWQDIVQSEGWMEYLANFLIQFFHVPCLGSAMLALVIALVYLFVHQICKRVAMAFGFKGDLFQLSVLPSLWLFFYTMSVEHSLALVVEVFLVLFVAAFVAVLCPKKCCLSLPFRLRKLSDRRRMVVSVLFLAGYALAGYFYFIASFSRGERIMLKTEQCVESKEWDKVLEYTRPYLESHRNNQLISYFHHLALYHTGGLLYHLFDYPQKLGVKALSFPWNSDSRESEYGHFLYEELGYLNEAQRWEFEAMVVWGETASHLRNLARYNIANNRPLVAQRFINKLKQSLFYRDDAASLEALLKSGKEIPGLKNTLKNAQESPARFSNILNIGPELQYICTLDMTNRMAFEYLMCHLLLSNHVVRFVQNLKWMNRFSYASMPPAFEEALSIYKLGVGEEAFLQLGIPISTDTEQRFKRYCQLVQEKKLRILQAEFGKTYWFYLNYISPYGNKVLSN